MDMTIIDTVPAATVEVGDSLRFIVEGEDLGIQEVRHTEDQVQYGLDVVLLISENDEEMTLEFDTLVDLYGYTDDTEE